MEWEGGASKGTARRGDAHGQSWCTGTVETKATIGGGDGAHGFGFVRVEVVILGRGMMMAGWNFLCLQVRD
ncbi:hypothetical protein M0R45_009123 [Rubus argutus]|uniref:Uncharacterized protein n=1 Tax=Rubus argutus TaxID=59490 RepID=A0AAW1Y420_RUBAR